MKRTLFIAVATSIVLVGTLAARQAQQGAGASAQVPSVTAATPTECLAKVRDYVAAKNKEAGITGGPITDRAFIAQAQQINAQKATMAAGCVLKFDVKAIPDSEVASLLDLYMDAGTVGDPRAALTRGLSVMNLPAADRARVLASALNLARRITPTQPGRDGRQAEMYPRMEQIVDELDKSSAATIEQKFAAHQSMLGSYRGDDIDAGIIKHATWMLDAEKAFTPELSKRFKPSLTSAYVDMSEAWAGQGMTDKALELLRFGLKDQADVPRAAEEIQPEIARLELVGTPAASITAPRWLNADAKTMPMTGHVTLLEFTAHWCGPCRESYPGINRLRAKYGKDGFQVVMATRFWGYFSSPEKGVERNITAEDELARDKAYFAEHHLDVPVAIGDLVTAKVVDGKVVYEPHPDPNDSAYRVGGIPQIQIIDKKGVIRRIIVGYDNANEPRLDRFIQSLIAEK